MRIFEYYRKTLETYIFIQVNLDGDCVKFINIDINFLKHMIEHLVLNSSINLNIIELNDNICDYHHIIEDLGLCIGYALNNCLINRNEIIRYGFYYIILEDSVTRVIIDCSGRTYLKYILTYDKIYLNNININILFDFFYSLVNNFKINLYIENIFGNNLHHKIETIFKALGKCLKISIEKNKNKINSTKGILL